MRGGVIWSVVSVSVQYMSFGFSVSFVLLKRWRLGWMGWSPEERNGEGEIIHIPYFVFQAKLDVVCNEHLMLCQEFSSHHLITSKLGNELDWRTKPTVLKS